MQYTANGLTVRVTDDDEIPIETRSVENGERVVKVTLQKVKQLSPAQVFYYLKGLHAKQRRTPAA
jgi:hypothetical protein